MKKLLIIIISFSVVIVIFLFWNKDNINNNFTIKNNIAKMKLNGDVKILMVDNYKYEQGEFIKYREFSGKGLDEEFLFNEDGNIINEYVINNDNSLCYYIKFNYNENKQIVKKYFQPFYDHNTLDNTYELINSINWRETNFEYDNNDSVIKLVMFDNSDKTSSIVVYDRDNTGTVKVETYYTLTGSSNRRWKTVEYLYNNNQKIEIDTTNMSYSKTIKIFKYNKLISREYILKENKSNHIWPGLKIEYTYIDDLLLERKSYEFHTNLQIHKLDQTTKYEYNEFSDIIKESTISHLRSHGNDLYTYSYIYDNNNNWTYKLTKKNGISTYKTTRHIEYY